MKDEEIVLNSMAQFTSTVFINLKSITFLSTKQSAQKISKPMFKKEQFFSNKQKSCSQKTSPNQYSRKYLICCSNKHNLTCHSNQVSTSTLHYHLHLLHRTDRPRTQNTVFNNLYFAGKESIRFKRNSKSKQTNYL